MLPQTSDLSYRQGFFLALFSSFWFISIYIDIYLSPKPLLFWARFCSSCYSFHQLYCEILFAMTKTHPVDTHASASRFWRSAPKQGFGSSIASIWKGWGGGGGGNFRPNAILSLGKILDCSGTVFSMFLYSPITKNGKASDQCAAIVVEIPAA